MSGRSRCPFRRADAIALWHQAQRLERDAADIEKDAAADALLMKGRNLEKRARIVAYRKGRKK